MRKSSIRRSSSHSSRPSPSSSTPGQGGKQKANQAKEAVPKQSKTKVLSGRESIKDNKGCHEESEFTEENRLIQEKENIQVGIRAEEEQRVQREQRVQEGKMGCAREEEGVVRGRQVVIPEAPRLLPRQQEVEVEDDEAEEDEKGHKKCTTEEEHLRGRLEEENNKVEGWMKENLEEEKEFGIMALVGGKSEVDDEDEVMEVEQERLPTPDIIDLMDSDDEDRGEAGGSLQEGAGGEVGEELGEELGEEVGKLRGRQLAIPEAPRLLPRRQDAAVEEGEGGEEMGEVGWRQLAIPKAPRLLPRRQEGEDVEDEGGQDEAAPAAPRPTARKRTGEPGLWCPLASPSVPSPAPSSAPTHSPDASGLSTVPCPVAAIMLARKHTGPRGSRGLRGSRGARGSRGSRGFRGSRGSRGYLMTHTSEVGDSQSSEGGLAATSHPSHCAAPGDGDLLRRALAAASPPPDPLPGPSSDPSLNPLADPFPPTGPSSSFGPADLSVYRGKVRGRGARGRAPSTRGVRKHVHVPWTMSGLRRSATIAVVKEEAAVHECQECGVKYDKFRSLQIHQQRTHNSRARVECPEGCGKLLSTTAAIRKHLLSHRPEDQWPFACPLCGKRFQARGDIPKHLMTRIHSTDNVPVMGSKEWFDLIYWDDPKYDYAAMKVKMEKQESKGLVRRAVGLPQSKVEGQSRPRTGQVEEVFLVDETQNEQVAVEGEQVGVAVEQVAEYLVEVVGEQVEEQGAVQPTEVVEEQEPMQGIEAVPGLDELNFVLVDPMVEPLQSVFLPA